MAATEKRLGELHAKVAEVLSEALDGEELPGYTTKDEDGNEEVVEAKRLPPSAAIIAAATKFLKDNEITCVPSENNALGDLEAKMQARRERRTAKVVDFEQAKADAQFAMRG